MYRQEISLFPRLFIALFFSLFSLSVLGEVQITKQPESKDIFFGSPVSFSVEVIATVSGEEIFYQWYHNGQVLGGATSATYSIASLQSTNLGTYWVKAGNLDSAKESVRVNLSGTVGVNSKIFTAIELEFATETGNTYLIQSSPDLGTWTNFSSTITGTGSPESRLIPARANAGTFYRVVQRFTALRSINGLTISFAPAPGQIYSPPQIAFLGLNDASSGSYHSIGDLSDAGSYTFSAVGATATLNVNSTANGGANAKFLLDFSTKSYSRIQGEQVVETGSFAFSTTIPSPIPLSLNGLSIFAIPATGPATQIAFTGLPGALNGLYHAVIGNLIDDGSYTFSLSGMNGTLNVTTSLTAGIGATFALDFSTSLYTKTQSGNILESGAFTF